MAAHISLVFWHGQPENRSDSVFVLGFENNGGQGRNRTADAGLFRAALYQLSYLAIGD